MDKFYLFFAWVAYLCIIDCNSVYYRVATSYHIDSLLACLINADACDAWPACRDSPHAFLVVLFAASNSRVCVPDCFSFFPFSFFFLSAKFFLSLSLTLYIICTWSPWGWLNGLSSGNRTTIDTLSLLPAANFLLSTPTANPNICLWASSFTSNFVPASSGAQGMKERELLSQPETVHWKCFFYLLACLFTVHEFIENVPAK